MKVKLFSFLYIFSITLLFFYSYTQVDLSLTLSKISIYQTIEKFFQYIGYFNRPLSTAIYIAILLLLFGCYIHLLLAVREKKISPKHLWILIILTTCILTFSYNAFSYDLFNYIFDAKIITHYFQNPYLHKALDFPKDPMLSFMHWTQRTYPYGPIWLLLTVPLSFIGLQYFLPTFFFFKIFISLSYIGIAYFIGKSLKQYNKQKYLLGVTIFAFNPLVIIESLVSSHIDSVMMFFCILSVYYLLSTKNIRSFFYLLISGGIKFATFFLIPVYLFVYFYRNNIRKKNNWFIVFLSCLFLMTLGVITETVRTNFQPWYFLIVIPFVALIPKRYTLIPSLIFSLFSLIQYIPFLYTGAWNPPIPTFIFFTTWIGFIIAILSGLFLVMGKSVLLLPKRATITK